MEPFSRAVALQSGVTLTLVAWPYTQFAAHFQDYRALLQAFREQAGEDADSPLMQRLLDRVVLASVPSEADRAQLQAGDLDELLESIFELNRLRAVAAKALSLYGRLLQAEAEALEPPSPSPPTPS